MGKNVEYAPISKIPSRQQKCIIYVYRRRITHIHFQGYVLSPQKKKIKNREMWVIGILKISKEQIRQHNRPTQNQIHHSPSARLVLPFAFPMRMRQMIMALQNLMIRFILCSCILRFVVVYFSLSLVAWFIFSSFAAN